MERDREQDPPHDPDLKTRRCRRCGIHSVDMDVVECRTTQEPEPNTGPIYVIFDGPPGPEAGRFVEVVDADGQSINAGRWIEQLDGTWALEIAR